MSGSKSSVPDAGAVPEGLSFTVHSMPVPALAERRRTLTGRLQMLLILAACVAPVVASYLAFYVVRPSARTNYATLIDPVRELPQDLPLQTLDGQPVPAASLRGQWLLVAVGPSACDAACERRLYLQRQLREMLGRERDRVDRVWLVTDGGTPAPALQQGVGATGPMAILHADGALVGAWLQPETGRRLEEHLYLVDPMGRWMMRAPAELDPMAFKRDLERLLRASASWDRAGR